jgi:hypothetical protein
MSGLQEIEVLIHPDGRVQVHVRGIKGESCRDLTAELERYLGGRVLQRKRTDEYLEQPQLDEEPARSRTGDR